MTTKDDSVKWVVERLQVLQQEHEEARRANREVDHAACRIASESHLQELLRAHDQLDEARAEVERLRADLQRAYDARSQQAVYASEHANRAEAYRVACLQAEAEVERLKAEIQPRIERSIAFQDAMEEAEAERDAALAEVQRLQELRQRGCDCNDEDACRFARERDEARVEVMRLQADVERLRDAAYRAGQEAMLRRCIDAIGSLPDNPECCPCDLDDHHRRRHWSPHCEGWQDAMDRAESAIRALEVQP